LARRLDQVRNFGTLVILWSLEHPRSRVVDHEDGAIVHRVAAGDPAGDEVRYDISFARLGGLVEGP
jgi:hypothetical protein